LDTTIILPPTLFISYNVGGIRACPRPPPDGPRLKRHFSFPLAFSVSLLSRFVFPSSLLNFPFIRLFLHVSFRVFFASSLLVWFLVLLLVISNLFKIINLSN
jgi:hypothetical protein